MNHKPNLDRKAGREVLCLFPLAREELLSGEGSRERRDEAKPPSVPTEEVS